MASWSTWSYLHFGSLLLNVRTTHSIKSPQRKLRAFFRLKKDLKVVALVLPRWAAKRMMVRSKFTHVLTGFCGLNPAFETLS